MWVCQDQLEVPIASPSTLLVVDGLQVSLTYLSPLLSQLVITRSDSVCGFNLIVSLPVGSLFRIVNAEKSWAFYSFV